MKGILCFLLGVLPVYAFSQTTFSQTYPRGLDGDILKDLVTVSPNEYAFITSTIFYRVDGQGKVLTRVNLHQGLTTILESMVTDGAGNFYIAGYIAQSVQDFSTVLIKLNNQGQVLYTKPIFAGSSHMLKICPFANNRFFVSYIVSAGNDYEMVVTLLDEQGEPIWKKRATDQCQNRFAVQAGPNGVLNIVYHSRPGNEPRWLQSDGMGNITEGVLPLVAPAGASTHTLQIHATADGGFIAVGHIAQAPKVGDGLLYKVDANRQVSWQQSIDLYRGDQFKDIVPVGDGYIIAAEAGLDGDWGGNIAGDMVILKTDLQGNVQWKRALGSAQADQAIRLLAPDANHLLIGGRLSYPGFATPVPVLFKTNREGHLQTALPFQPTLPAGLHRILLNNTAPEQILRGIVPADNGTYIGGGNLLHTDDDLIYPYALKVDQNGREILHRVTAVGPGIVKAVTTSKDGFFFVLTEQETLFDRFYTLNKMASGGNSYWIANFGSNTIRHMAGTADGGCLLVGGEGRDQGNFDVSIIKIDKDGNEVWRKKYGLSTNWEIANSIIETPEHDFIIAGTSQTAYGINSQGHVIKIDKDGKVLWSKSYNTGKTHAQFADIALAPDGYVLTGTAGMAYDQKDVYLMRLDRQGNMLWEKIYDLYLQDNGVSLVYTAGDTILVAGNTGEPLKGHLEKYGFLMKLDKEGNRLGTQYFGETAVQTSITKMWVQEGRLMIAGNAQEEYGKAYMFFTEASTGMILEPGPGPQPETTSQLIVYPNPAHSKAFISMKNNFTGPVNIVLYNTTGQQVMVLQRTKTSFELKEEVPLGHLPSGMYYFFIQHGSDKSVQSIRVINR